MILVINSGSSSVKFAVYGISDSGAVSPVCRGEVGDIGSSPKFTLRDGNDIVIEGKELDLETVSGHEDSVKWIEGWIESNLPDLRFTAVGHRVVHGGAVFRSPAIIDVGVMAKLAELEKLAPLHQPYNLAGIRAVMSAHPEIPQVACFDTSFHRTQPKVAQMFGLPREFFESGVLRYGFHGLSYEYIVKKMREVAPAVADGRLIAAHLGNGASMCAIEGGRSVATTMGFTAVDGLPMGTRSGSIDPGVIFYLVRERGYELDKVEELLYRNSGLLGISGITNDMKALESSVEPDARLAVEYFVYRSVREVGSLAGALGGLDALVFTGGIGENSAFIRGGISRGLKWLGIEIDEETNAGGKVLISKPENSPAVYVIPTNEELMIAHHTAKTFNR
ncbi:MAG: acetate/propionate family kinase [Deltaproteobacteria bacterium]